MKNLDIVELEKIQAGDAMEFVDGACAVVTAAGAIGFMASMLNPASAAVTGFCAGWTIARSFPE